MNVRQLIELLEAMTPSNRVMTPAAGAPVEEWVEVNACIVDEDGDVLIA